MSKQKYPRLDLKPMFAEMEYIYDPKVPVEEQMRRWHAYWERQGIKPEDYVPRER